MKSCEDIRNNLVDYLDTRTDGDLTDAIDQHLNRCKACQLELKKLENTRKLLQKAYEPVTPPSILDAKIMEHARQQVETIPEISFWRFLFRPWPAAVALTILLLSVTHIVIREHDSIEEAVLEKSDLNFAAATMEDEKKEGIVVHLDQPDSNAQTDSKTMNLQFYKPDQRKETEKAPGKASLGRERTGTTRKKRISQSSPPAAAPEPPQEINVATNSALVELGYITADHSASLTESEDIELELHIISQKPGSIRYILEQGVKAPVVIDKPTPTYPGALRNNAVEGTVTISGTVNIDGRLVNVEIDESSHDGFNQSVLDTLEQWRFTPGLKNSQPVPVPCTIQFVFSQDNSGG